MREVITITHAALTELNVGLRRALVDGVLVMPMRLIPATGAEVVTLQHVALPGALVATSSATR